MPYPVYTRDKDGHTVKVGTVIADNLSIANRKAKMLFGAQTWASAVHSCRG